MNSLLINKYFHIGDLFVYLKKWHRLPLVYEAESLH
jgi:hypothetical protein